VLLNRLFVELAVICLDDTLNEVPLILVLISIDRLVSLICGYQLRLECALFHLISSHLFVYFLNLYKKI
jgi:hypothetical protein